MEVKNQILKELPKFFKEELKKMCIAEKQYVMLNPSHYKKIEYSGLVKEFLDKVEPYYHKSKKHYVNRPDMNYIRFVTVLRQIANSNGVFFEYKIKYTNSKHYIEYYFYLESNNINPMAE